MHDDWLRGIAIMVTYLSMIAGIVQGSLAEWINGGCE